MGKIEIFVTLLTIIVIVGIVFRKSPIPTSLLLVITGMLVSLIPSFPPITLNPTIVLDVFLPLLIYKTSAYSSWHDIKLDFRPNNSVKKIDGDTGFDEKMELKDTIFLYSQLLNIERKELARLWREGKTNQAVKVKVGHQLDIRPKRLNEMF